MKKRHILTLLATLLTAAAAEAQQPAHPLPHPTAQEAIDAEMMPLTIAQPQTAGLPLTAKQTQPTKQPQQSRRQGTAKSGNDPYWTSIGTATYTDDFVTGIFTRPNYSYAVTIQECDTLSGFYRLVDPYGSCYPGNTATSCDTLTEYMYIHAENPAQVYVEHYFSSGMTPSSSYGEMRMSSLAGYRLAGGQSVAAGEWGTLDTLLGAITFPSRKLMVSLLGYHNGGWAVANKNGAFRVQLPGYPDYSFSYTLGSLTEHNDGTATQRIVVTPTNDTDFAGFRYGVFTAQELGTQRDSCISTLFTSGSTTTAGYCDVAITDSGANYVLIVSATTAGTAAHSQVVTVNHSPSQYWTSLGTYTLRDALISEMFANISPQRWTAELQRYNAADSIYRLKDPYLNYPLQFNTEQRFTGRYVTATVSHDTAVAFASQPIGINISNYGELSARSAPSRYGTIDTVRHELTFPTNGMAVTVPAVGTYYANAQGTFLLAKVDSAYNLQVADTVLALLERDSDSIRWSSDYATAPTIASSNSSVVRITGPHTFYAAGPGEAVIRLSYPLRPHLLAEADSIRVSVEADTNTVPAAVQGWQVQLQRMYDGSNQCAVLAAGTLDTISPRFPDVAVQTTATYADKRAGTGKAIWVRHQLTGADADHYLLATTDTLLNNGEITCKPLTLTPASSDSTVAGTLTTQVCSDLPVYALYNHSLTEQLYRSSLVGHAAAQMEAIDFYYHSNTAQPLNRKVKVYLRNVGSDTAALPQTTGHNWIDFAESDLVYSGTLAADSSATVRITFDQPFAYAGGHLLVAVRDTTGQWSSRQFHHFGTDYNSSLTAYSDQVRPTTANLGSVERRQGQQLANACFHFRPDSALVRAADKVYDGSTAAAVTLLAATEGTVAGDDVQVVPYGNFASRNTGSQAVAVHYSLRGVDAANYQAPASDTTAAAITPAPLRMEGTQVAPYKLWDGTTACAVTDTGSLVGLAAGDSVTLTVGAAFETASKGRGKTVHITYALGTDDTNYTAPAATTRTSDIISDTIRVTIATSGNGTTLPAAGNHIYRLGDTLRITPTADSGQMFDHWVTRRNGTAIDTDYAVQMVRTLDYTMCDNQYSYTAHFGTQRPVCRIRFVRSGDGNGRVYLPGKRGHDYCGRELLTDSAQRMTFIVEADSGSRLHNLGVQGAGEPAMMSQISPTVTFLTDTIRTDVTWTFEFDTIVALTVSGTQVAADKIFDNTTDATVTDAGTCSGLRTGDTVTLAATARYSWAYAGDSVPITITYTLGGADAAYYTLAQPSAAQTGRIKRKPLEISGQHIDGKEYDGTCTVHASSCTAGTLTGVVAGTTVACEIAEAHYVDPNAGEGKTVLASYRLSGTHAGCYLPPEDDTLAADIHPRPVQVDGTRVDTLKTYDGSTRCRVTEPGHIISGLLAGDTATVNATADYASKNVGSGIPITTHFTFGGPQGGNYSCTGYTSTCGTIRQRELAVLDGNIRLAKEYDGTCGAVMAGETVMDSLAADDSVTVVTTAQYDTPEVGHGKTITAHYALTGIDAPNYICPEGGLYSTEGKIILPTRLDTLENGSPLAADAEGYCQGDEGSIRFSTAQGEPSHYRLTFGATELAAGFRNTDWTALPADGWLTLAVPEQCKEGNYRVTVTLKNEAETETEPMEAAFTVNLSQEYMVQLYDDVISIDNREGRFSSYQWYKDGTAISGATSPYYRERGGLSGVYHVRVNIGQADEARTCGLPFDTKTQTPAITASPNPATAGTTVRLQGMAEGEHLLQLFNTYGTEMMRRTFGGNELTIDLSRLPQGTYMVRVDGAATKIVKL